MILGFGVDLVVHETARRLADMDHEVIVFTTRTSDLYSEINYEIINLKDRIPEPDMIFSPHFMTESIRILSTFDIDVWIAETPPFYQWLQYLRPPVILVEHGTPPGHFFDKRMGTELDAMTEFRYNVIFQGLRSGDRVVAISDYIMSCLPANVQRKTTVIANGADHYPPAHPDSAAQFRTDLGIAEDDIMVLWVGRIEPFNDLQPYKGLGEFLTIAPQIQAQFPKIRVVAVGRAHESAREPLEKAGIIPVFNVPKETMSAVFAAADIFLNTSRWEGFNLALAEAQFQGTPVVAYDVCAHPQVVCNGESGILAGNVAELKAAVIKLAGDKALRLHLAEGAKHHARQFTWDENAKKLDRLITECYAASEPARKRFSQSAHLVRLPPYYIWKARMLVKRFGWHVLIRESFFSFLRRLKLVK